MDKRILNEMIGVIRKEQNRLTSQRGNQDPDIAYDQWLFSDRPFINELCLMLLVTIRHLEEKELVSLAARAMNNGEPINHEQYRDNVNNLKKGTKWDWGQINELIHYKSISGYADMKLLGYLANSYKHDLFSEPNNGLLKQLKIKRGVNYVSLADGGELETKLAESIDLSKDSNYCDIVERFAKITETYIQNVIKNNPQLSPLKREPLNIDPEKFSR